MRTSLPSLTPFRPQLWKGRYARIPGTEPVFHVRLRHSQWQPVAAWTASDEIATCPMRENGAAAELATAVNAGKRFLGSQRGGSFVINEFGQVLVPASAGDGRIALVGEWRGALEFEDPLHGGTFDLASSDMLENGDAWERPYIGVPYNLSHRSEVYCWVTDASGGAMKFPPTQDKDLINALRAVRPSGPVRFIVLCGGLVVTKVPRSKDWTTWEPRYVGRLNYDRWFSKEQ